MRYHLIAIGGSVMHNLAIDLKDLGHLVTGSDDEIYEPSRSRLAKYGLLPIEFGWFPEKITADIDVIILGKHARLGNPELEKAQSLNISIQSFPEFISTSSKATTRICVAGSHGKTSTTSMIMFVLKDLGFEFDYLVGASIEGFEKMVKLSGADILVVEADEYPSSCIDDDAKMLHYNPTISVITGVAWDHVNIYKTYESYLEIFERFLAKMDDQSVCYFDQTDDELVNLVVNKKWACLRKGYFGLPADSKSRIKHDGQEFQFAVFGKHNMLNLNAAMLICRKLGISDAEFYTSAIRFKGASKRLELMLSNEKIKIYRDFAHAPSKCKATVKAILDRYPKSKITAVLELHTFSSLSKEFVPQYKNALEGIAKSAVYYDNHALKMKKMAALDKPFVYESFGTKQTEIINDPDELLQFINQTKGDGTDILLLMSSGNLGGFDLNNFIDALS